MYFVLGGILANYLERFSHGVENILSRDMTHTCLIITRFIHVLDPIPFCERNQMYKIIFIFIYEKKVRMRQLIHLPSHLP